MAKVNLPNENLDYIKDGERVKAEIANRPNKQIHVNTRKIRDRLSNTIDTISAVSNYKNAEIYSSSKIYFKNDIVKDKNGKLYISKTNDNLNHPLTDSKHWQKFTLTFYDTIVDNDLIVNGDLTINGDLTNVNTKNLEIEDNEIILNKGEKGAGVSLGKAGISIDRGSLDDAKIIFDEKNKKWKAGIGDNIHSIAVQDGSDVELGNVFAKSLETPQTISTKTIISDSSNIENKWYKLASISGSENSQIRIDFQGKHNYGSNAFEAGGIIFCEIGNGASEDNISVRVFQYADDVIRDIGVVKGSNKYNWDIYIKVGSHTGFIAQAMFKENVKFKFYKDTYNSTKQPSGLKRKNIYRIFSTANNGKGSGIDADKLDGYDSSDYVRKKEKQALNNDALRLNGTKIQLYKGDGSHEEVDIGKLKGLDADKLDGYDSSDFIRFAQAHYDIWESWLREKNDNKHFKIFGNSRQIVFRTDGSSQYASGIGDYPFVWMYGGDHESNKRMVLDIEGGLWTSKYGWLHDRFYGVIDEKGASVGHDNEEHWITIAVAPNARRYGKIIVTDIEDSDHTFIEIDWMRSYADSKIFISQVGGYKKRIKGVRVLSNAEDKVYKEKYLQILVSAKSYYSVRLINKANKQSGWENIELITPKIEDSKSGYIIQGKEIRDLDKVGTAVEGLSTNNDILFTGTPKNSDDNLGIIWRAWDKEGPEDNTDYGYIKQTTNKGGLSGSVLEIKQGNDSNDGVLITTRSNTGFKHNGHVVWTSGNNGSGSGLDADKLDGIDSSQFVRNDIENTKGISFVNKKGGSTPIIFQSGVNYGSDKAIIRYDDDNDSYNRWGNTDENSALVLRVENDGKDSVSDVIALESPAGIFLNAPEVFIGDKHGSKVISSNSRQALHYDALRISGSTLYLYKGDGSHEEVRIPGGLSSSRLDTNGYQKFSNGLIIQWGRKRIWKDSTIRITFPITFPHRVFVASYILNAGRHDSSKGENAINYISRTSMLLNHGSDLNGTAMWIAIGY